MTMTTEPPQIDEPVKLPVAAERAGVTYRQLHHWVSQGYVPCQGNPTPGSGGRILMDPEHVMRAWLMGRLVAAGIAPTYAAEMAANLALNGRVDLDGQISVRLETP